ncbi:MAG: NUDIX hydrolase [Azospira oryzae]|nr:MAG: NUDIX hydrolase [Azospira oryzae]PZP77248.1 MAG: NUDIX hydrolase [Azospira oryzae]
MTKSDLTEKRLRSRSVFDGKLLRVKVDEVQLPDGAKATREYVMHPGAVVMIAFLDERHLLLERQFRYPLGREFYELPAGKISPGEDPLRTAERELKEETGYRAKSWSYVSTVHPCIGYSDERLIYYLARDLTFEGERLDDGEFLETLVVELGEALEWVRLGRITDGKSVAGLFWAEKIARGEWPLPDSVSS